MKTPFTLLTLLAIAVQPSISEAAVFFTYDGIASNYIGAGAEYRNTDGTDFTTGTTRAYSESAALSPVIGGSYSGPSFLGGIGVITGSGGITHGETGLFNAFDIDRSATTELADALRLGFGTNSTAALLIMAEMAGGMDWTNAADAWIWRGSRNGGSGNTGTVRPVVKIGSQYYISDYQESMSNSVSTMSFLLTEVSTWSLYDPFTGLGYASNTPGALPLENITHAGFLMTMARTTTANDLRVGSFSISGTAPVPEPSHAMLSLLAMGTLLIRRRR